MPYNTVVLGIHEDMPDRSIRLNAGLSVETGTKLVLVAAYTPGTGSAQTFDVASAAERALEKAMMMCAEFGHHNVESHAVPGDPVRVLSEAVTQHDAGLLVVGSRGLAGLADRLLGSVPGNLARQVDCDVLVVHTTGNHRRHLFSKRSRDKYQRTIVVGVHDSPRSLRAAERAGAIAADYDAELVLVGAYEDMDWTELKKARDTLREESYLVQGTFPIESALRDGEAKARAKGAAKVEQLVVHGDAMKGLLKVADERQADVLVLGNHQLTGRMSQLIGSISAQVSRKTDTHVLLVH
ncbi:MAG TPA: universal stress protein [Pseudonocardia sp.]|jgi:nucleotide-binding universal stress UspA family protein